MKRYKSLLNEYLIDGQVKGFTGKSSQIREIESKQEFNELSSNCRGVIYNNKLWMTTNPDAYIMHEGLVSYLIKKNIIKKSDILNSKRNDLLDIYLRVIKFRDGLILGDGLYITKDNKDIILSYLPLLSKLKIKFIKNPGYK